MSESIAKQAGFTEGVRDMAFAVQDEVGDRSEFMPGEFEEMLERLREQLILRGPEG